MKQEILTHLENPGQLEQLFRQNKLQFRLEFNALYPDIRGNVAADFWYERLNYETVETNRGLSRDWILVIILALAAGIIAKLPAILSIDEEFFYTRNAGFILFPVLSAFFAWKNRLTIKKTIVIFSIMLASLLYINLTPFNSDSDTFILSCIHLPLFLWTITGFAFTGDYKNITSKRMAFLEYNGDVLVMSTLMLIAGGLLSAITIGLFSLLGINIEEFYFKNIVIVGVAAVPVIATHLTRTNPQLVGKVSPVIAKIFSPLVLLMLVIYLGAMIYSGSDPFHDREFLMIFNVLLIGVMALIFFSITGASRSNTSKSEIWLLTALSIITIIVNGIALSAILFRISEWGITPNRVAVLGANALMLVNLLLITLQLFRIISGRKNIDVVGNTITSFLPIYGCWALVVTFVFPFIFGF